MKQVPLANEGLSEYPSEAILQALEDLEAVENTPGWGINMDVWKDACSVCQAGAVMVRRFPVDGRVSPFRCASAYGKTQEDIDLLWDQLDSFDDLRRGYIEIFLHNWIKDEKDIPPITKDLEDLKWVSYEYDSAQYKRNLRRVARVIAKHGY